MSFHERVQLWARPALLLLAIVGLTFYGLSMNNGRYQRVQWDKDRIAILDTKSGTVYYRIVEEKGVIWVEENFVTRRMDFSTTPSKKENQ